MCILGAMYIFTVDICLYGIFSYYISVYFFLYNIMVILNLFSEHMHVCFLLISLDFSFAPVYACSYPIFVGDTGHGKSKTALFVWEESETNTL